MTKRGKRIARAHGKRVAISWLRENGYPNISFATSNIGIKTILEQSDKLPKDMYPHILVWTKKTWPLVVTKYLKQEVKNIIPVGGKKNYKQKSIKFFASREWRELRYKVLRKYGARCQCCGRSAKDGIIIHVDHIKPRSKYPELELVFDNLQILCDDCNLGKSNIDETDWRTIDDTQTNYEAYLEAMARD